MGEKWKIKDGIREGGGKVKWGIRMGMRVREGR
jgi:hypothetical protein